MTEMVELFSIQVFNNQSKDGSIRGGELYGAILGNDRCGNSFYFKQEGGLSDNSILPDDTLSLTGPYRCNVGDNWRLRIKLYLKKDQNYLELSNGYLEITPADHYFFDRSMSGMVLGKDGYALVNLATFDFAVQATIEGSVVTGIGHGFYGHIQARNDDHNYNNKHERSYFQTTLFNASKDKPCYSQGRKIPLSRRVTAVPLQGRLTIKAQLFELNHSLVACGDTYFEAQTCGDDTKTIGCIQIKVTWAQHQSHCRSKVCNLCSPA